MAPSHQVVDYDTFNSKKADLTEVSSEIHGAYIISCSDDFFAPASNLLRAAPPEDLTGQYGPNGSLMDGWESRRHNREHDWVIVKLAAEATLEGIMVDTGYFDGNEAPRCEVWAGKFEGGEPLLAESTFWESILPMVDLSPASPHYYLLTSPTKPFTHVKLTMHPDGGIGRLRIFGLPIPPATDFKRTPPPIDLLSIENGGKCLSQSDEHNGVGSNLLLPGRGKDMEDGWHTRRSRNRLGTTQGDWVILRLGSEGHVDWLEVDTLHFIGNYPVSAKVEAIRLERDPVADDHWTTILSETKMRPNVLATFKVVHIDQTWTHLKLSIFPEYDPQMVD